MSQAVIDAMTIVTMMIISGKEYVRFRFSFLDTAYNMDISGLRAQSVCPITHYRLRVPLYIHICTHVICETIR